MRWLAHGWQAVLSAGTWPGGPGPSPSGPPHELELPHSMLAAFKANILRDRKWKLQSLKAWHNVPSSATEPARLKGKGHGPHLLLGGGSKNGL